MVPILTLWSLWGCSPGVMPDPCEIYGVRIADSEYATNTPYLLLIATNWLRQRGDPDGWYARVTWQYPMDECKTQISDELLGDLNADGIVNLEDFALWAEYRECGRQWRLP